MMDTRRRLLGVTGAVLLGWIALGCGGDGSSAPAPGTSPSGGAPAGTGGTSPVGGSGVGTGGLTAPDPTTATPLEACLYIRRIIGNKAYRECVGLPNEFSPDPISEPLCPDIYFADGSNQTVAGLLECAKAWQAASCKDVNEHRYPDCGVVAGKRPLGATCKFGVQCASRNCKGAAILGDTCGQCAPLVEEGGACSESGSCAQGLECQSTVCTRMVPSGLPAGSACERFGQCAASLVCIQLVNQTSTSCQPLPAIGSACPQDVSICAAGAVCDATTKTCVAPPTLGQTCGSYGGCAQGLYCDTAATGDAVCRKLGALGESCRPDDGEFSLLGCEQDLICDCADESCSTGSCVKWVDPGDSCAEDHIVCRRGSECQNGICVPTGNQGLADACVG